MKTYTVTFCRAFSHTEGTTQTKYAAGSTHHDVSATIVAALRSVRTRTDIITDEPAPKAQPVRSKQPDVQAESEAAGQ